MTEEHIVSLVGSVIENSSVMAFSTILPYNILNFKTVTLYLKDKEITPRRSLAYLFERRKNKDKVQTLEKYENELKEFIEYYEKKDVMNADDYKKYGIICYSCDIDTEIFLENKLMSNDALEFDMPYLSICEIGFYDKIMERCKCLSENHPELWHDALDKIYFELFKIILEISILVNIKTSILSDIFLMFTFKKYNHIKNAVEKYGDNYRIALLQEEKLRYICMLEETIEYTNDYMINVAIEISKNKQKYLDDVRLINEKNYNEYFKNILTVYPNAKLINKTNSVTFEDINNFMPIDILRYTDTNGNIYQFTRDEYKILCPHGQTEIKNFYIRKSMSKHLSVKLLCGFNTINCDKRTLTTEEIFDKYLTKVTIINDEVMKYIMSKQTKMSPVNGTKTTNIKTSHYVLPILPLNNADIDIITQEMYDNESLSYISSDENECDEFDECDE